MRLVLGSSMLPVNFYRIQTYIHVYVIHYCVGGKHHTSGAIRAMRKWKLDGIFLSRMGRSGCVQASQTKSQNKVWASPIHVLIFRCRELREELAKSWQ